MLKLSPMPWKALDVLCRAELIQDANGRDLVMRQDGATISDMQLMAAARELYRALLIAESFMAGFEGDESQHGIDDHLAAIREAIKKAEGGAA